MKKIANFRNLFLPCCFLTLVDINFTKAAPALFLSFYDTSVLTKSDILFDSLKLGKLGLGRRAYDYAMLGYKALKAKGKLRNDKILSIIDFSLPSSKKRLFVIDVKNYKLLFVTYTAHGKNSGVDKTLYFSNAPESNKSSVGFYTTLGTYSGEHGYSLRLQGHEIGFNDKAESRDIVIHGADYVEESVIRSQGYIGRSLGCPALSPEIYKQVIAKIKDGTCLFVYGNDADYITNSKLLKEKVQKAADSTHY
ncbi:MAG: murein L,D-transpeptidase catalytic domain family protein [Chitinophagaceae bacterium]|nr:murein L,D-transpeptidase catalytic domain family protein [Chitinophagaceae bacterium]